MRLIKCYINNFGLLHECEFNFSKGLNCCLSDNGTGKSTLSAFIEAMLYGIGDSRKTMLDENPRKKYDPWQGGKFGGALTVEIGKKKYTVERTFGSKPADDTFRLIDAVSGRESNDFSENIGEEIFGIDRDGFLRTVFLSEKNLQGKNTNKSISAKLSDLVGVDGDVGGFDAAKKLLEERRKFYSKKNNTGEIANVKEKIQERKRQLDSLARLSDEITERRERISVLTAERERLTRIESSEKVKLSDINAKKQRLSYEEAYSAMLANLNAERKKLEETERFFGGEIPTLRSVDDAKDAHMQSIRLREEGFGGSGDDEYLTLRKYFSAGTSFVEIAEMESAANELRVKEADLERLHAGRDNISLEMSTVFKGSAPTKEELKRAEESKGKSGKLIRTVAALIFTAACAALLFIGISNMSMPLIFGGAVSGIIALILLLIPSKSKELLSFCSKYYDGKGASTDKMLKEIKQKLEKYEEFLTSKKRKEAELEANITELKMKLYAFIGKFPKPSGDTIFEAILSIKSDYTRYYSLDRADKMQENSKIEKLRQSEALERKATDFTGKYPTVTSDPYTEIRDKINEYNHRLVMVQRLAMDCEAYSVKHGVTGKSAPTDSVSEAAVNHTLDEVHSKLSAINRECAILENDVSAALQELERKEEIEIMISDLEELLAKHTESLETIKATQKYLQEACDNITSKYLGKTKEKFAEYSELISGTDGEYALNTDFEISRTERGASRTQESYSRGMRDLYALSMRFALIDALYENESPFIILDDPLIAFDDAKIERAKAMLKSIAKQKQILYFTCAKAREVV